MTDPTSALFADAVPALRVQVVHPDRPPNPDGGYVLYWMCAQRRTGWNFALQRAIEHCRAFQRPLVVLEALRIGYPWASPRLHTFVAQGMEDNAAELRDAGVTHVTYMEREAGQGRGLLAALAADACVVVTDEFPCFFIPRMVQAAADALSVRLETVDSNGIAPLRNAERSFTTAASFRRHLQKTVWPHLFAFPAAKPLQSPGVGALIRGAQLPAGLAERWPNSAANTLVSTVASLQLDGPGAVEMSGGRVAGLQAVDRFFEDRFTRYPVDRNLPLNGAASGLSPYLHFGHVSAHEVVHRVFHLEGFTPGEHAPKSTGSRAGWWGMSEAAESFLDELITWREIGFNRCHIDPQNYDRYESLPGWALTTLAQHASDPRPYIYDLDTFANAGTHDPIWNAAQRQLTRTGVMHNYLRMLWGKKILEWTVDPQQALEVMLELNNRYALDGRDPNSYSGIFWTLGRYDRAWGPERPIFGKIRFMSSDSTKRKLKMDGYLREFGDDPNGQLLL